MSSYCGDSKLWDLDLLMNSSWPHFTACFQSSVLVFVPNGYLWCASIFYIPYLVIGKPGLPLRHTPVSAAKTIISVLLTVCAIIAVLSEYGFQSKSLPYPTAHYIARFVEGATYLLAAALTQIERWKGVITSGVLFIYWLLLSILDVVPLYSYIILKMPEENVARFSIFLMSFVLTLTQLFLQAFFADVPRNWHPGACPEIKATFLSHLTFSWMTKLIVSGFKRPLEAHDLWSLNPRDESTSVVPAFEKALLTAKTCKDLHFANGNSYSSFPSVPFTCKGRAIMNDKKNVPRMRSNSHDDVNENATEIVPLLSDGPSSDYRSVDKMQHQSQNTGTVQGPNIRWSLTHVLIRTYCTTVMLSYICKFFSDILQYISPLLLGLLIKHIQTPYDQPWKGFFIASCMLAASWTQTAFYHQHYHIAMTTGMRMKIALMSSIYKKSLRLSNKGQQEGGTVGEVVNLMAVDCQRVQDMMSYTWIIWSIPLQVMLAVYLLWDTLGLSVLAGVVLLVILVPINGYLAFHQQNLQKQNLQWKDCRVKLIHEILSGIKVLKLYAWETSFEEKVLNIRRAEIKVLTKVAHLNAFSIFIWTCAPYLVTLATFATYVLSDPEARLDANKAFVTLSLFNILQFPISFIPEMISFTAQALVSIKRIEKFLKQEELDPSLVSKSSMTEKPIQIERGHFSWDSQNGHSSLSSINIEISEGELVAVVGNVGSGKSSLLAAMLGEIQSLRGKVVVKGNVAYVPQQAWIQNASLKDNIIFGRAFDSRRFKKVLSSCALTADISILPGGEQTEIGEKGINLSGGQKQRVSLARAVYADADVYLLDDPLSAVDSHVGKHIFRNVISDKGLLKHKTRVLVTHAVHWLPLVDTVVLLQEGRIVEAGSYLQLMRRNGPLAQYLHFVLSTSDDTDAEDDPEVTGSIKLNATMAWSGRHIDLCVVFHLRCKMMEHVESVTSTSEGGTSGDDAVFARESRRFLQSQESKSLPPRSPSPAIMIAPFAAQLTEEEQAATGSVTINVFGSYAYHVGRLSCVVIFLLFAMYQVTNIYASFWLAEWTENPIILSSNATAVDIQKANKYYLTFYGICGAGQAVFISLYAWLAATQMVKAAGNMHAAMLDRVLRSPMSFFDTTPSGRIVNRFARDVETIDNTLPQIFFMFVMCVFSVLSTLCVISITTPLFMSVIFPLAVGYYALQRFFVPTSRQLKRLEAVTRSPIYNHFSETLSGASVIRAFGATNRFVRECLQRIDKNQVFYFAGITANRWLGVWIEMVSSIIVFASSVFALVTPDITGGQAGLSITYALQITQALKWLVRTVSDLETNIVSVERVQEYSELKTEAPRVTSVRPRLGWPSHGNVILANYSTRYRPGLDLVLKHIDVSIRGGEKVGIVGRTGAGKSSLTLALFRLIEPVTGTINIDGVDISSLGLCDLRSRITILPQDPVVFSGSLRMNLDPLGQFCDRELWDALHHAHLISFVRELPNGLEYDCGEEGRHLSVGQRQLLCLARGLLRRTKILILDEPTAAVDLETDLLIQGTIRKEFADCTTLTIAHRLNTIMDYDRILVLADGQVKEFDKPNTLLNDKDSIFYGLAHDAGLL